MNVVTAQSQALTIVAREPTGQAVGRIYRVTRVSTEEDLCALRGPWTALMARTDQGLLFETWEWVTTWWPHRNAGTDLWLLAAWDEVGELAGLLPLMRVQDRRALIRVRRLTFMGRGIVYPVHLDVVAARGEEKSLASAFASYLNAQRGEWDVLDLGDMNVDSALTGALSQMRGWVKELVGATARVSTLPATWQIYEKENLSSTRRKHLGQYRRKLEREHPGLVRFYEVSDPTDLRWALDAMSRLNRTRWHEKQVPSAFDDQDFVAFHHEVAPAMLEQGLLRFYVLRVGDEMAAAIYGFLYGNVFYCYQTAFNMDWGKYGPGQLMFGYGIEKAIGEGAREWNMLRGDQEYKLSWTDRERLDAHFVVSTSFAGHIWLLGGSLIDSAKTISKERLPRDLQDRLNKLISSRGMRKNEPAKPNDLSD